MNESYREPLIRCPVCDLDMVAQGVGGSTIDVCAGCGGLWIDWFDGDLQEMVRGAKHIASEGGVELEGSRSCPRCKRPLASDRFGEAGADILRCVECAGAFVYRASFTAIVGESRREELPQASAWARLLAVLRRVLHTNVDA